MLRRRFPIVIALLLVCFAVVGPVASAAERPNFVVFIADDMAWNDCGAYGHSKIRTPYVDQLARDGLRFDNAFLTCSSCSPSRSSMITGRYPHNTGAEQLHLPLPGQQVTFVERLKASGYYTASAGKWHLGKATMPKFDFVTAKMNQWVKTLQERPRDKPFFCWFAFTDPHRGYQKNTIPMPHKPSDAIVPPFLPDNIETRRDLAAYYDEIARLDGVVGACVKELEKQNATRETVIVFLSDNGRPFPRCKTTVLDSGIKTPWIVKWPGRAKPGTTTDSLISSIDLAPTVLELAGVKIGPTFQGKSFASILSDPKAATRQYVFAEHNWHDFDDHQRAVRSSRFKYIRNSYTDIPLTPPADAVRSPTYNSMLTLHASGKLPKSQSICFAAPRPAEELYDLAADSYEMKNLAGDPAYAKTLTELRGVLDGWSKRTDDVVPQKRRPDGFHRVTGERLQLSKKRLRTQVNPTRKRGTQENRAHSLCPSLTRRVTIQTLATFFDKARASRI